MSTVEQTPPHPGKPVEKLPPTHEPDLVRRERSALTEVIRLVAERAATEMNVEKLRTAGPAAADQEYARATRALKDKLKALDETARSEDDQRRREVIDTAIVGETTAKNEFAKASRRIAAEFDGARKRAADEQQQERADAAAGFEAGEREAAGEFAKAKRPIDDASRITEAYKARLDALFQAYQKFGLAEPSTKPSRESYDKFENPVDILLDRLTKVDKPLNLLEGLIFPKLMKGPGQVWLFIVMFALLIAPFVWLLDWAYGALGALCGAIALGLALRAWLINLSKTQVSRLCYPLFQTIVDADALAAYSRAKVEESYKSQRARVAALRDERLNQAKAKHTKTISTAEHIRDERLREINEVYARRIVEIQTKQQVDLRAAIESHERRKADVRTQEEAGFRKLDEKYEALKEKIHTRHETAWTEMAASWRSGIEKIEAELDEVARAVDALGPEWHDPSWADRPAPTAVPPVVRLGAVRVALEQLPGGLPSDPRLSEGLPQAFAFPALRPFPERTNLVIEAPAEARSAAIGVLQAAMLRLLTSLPPAAVRFTIIDPIGIGRNFGAFMHLADYDESLVNGQVWTDPRQIEERLADLAIHMEKVTQKYLRNDYATIEEYNAAAGEVAEPYRVVVIADFPAGFDEKSAARLAAIATGGVPCGVLLLVAIDPDRPLPTGILQTDLSASATCLNWDGGRLIWDDPDFGRYPLALESMPPAEIATRLIQRSAAAAREARRVEVPFEFIAPPASDWWTADSRAGIDVALGKSGATKRQHLALGRGTSQHVLIAGRTGSGKSTLLHALITNLALNYSPDEVELDLIDFKKGVEFKVYATHELPHAGVVAIESEREFGISVLQRLDGEMRARADKFRDAGVQDLNGYRNVAGTPPMPRVLLIVDEFQEFFVEEDKLAQEAALLLDRLVRQGRAFGMHIILGSQTLGGAFTLARTTLGQMAVRVALQCSETDAHLILSEQNTAARLLSRPGEAVYNDANGMAEGNHFFQVVWLSDERRETYLTRVDELVRARPPVLKRTPIIFEGDAPADLARNLRLKTLLEAPAWPSSSRSATAWVGDPVAIKDPTAALFRRQGGNHLLIVGQNEDSALGIMAAALLSLAAQYPPSASDDVRDGAKFAVLDGTPEDHPNANSLARVAELLPHSVDVGGWRETARVLGALAAEVSRRVQGDGPEIFLLIHDLARFRDLRKREDDFSFSRREEDASPHDHLRTLLREGPGVGIHVLIWCDNLNNLQRAFDHQTLREFEMRVLFQMSPNDSGHLLDSPAASKLGRNRALFASEEQNRLEKFRPYGMAANGWLEWVREQFRKRGVAVERS